jgi:chromosome segregation ATPase
METTQTIDRKPDFENVWAAIQATNEQMKETDRIIKENAQQMKETDRIIKENAQQMKETDRIIKENAQQMKETDRIIKENAQQMKETDKRVGEITNRFGEMVEYMVVPNLTAKFRELKFEFEKTHRDTVIASKEYDIYTEVDAFLENGDKVMIVEIKNKPGIDDINDHVKRMEKLRAYADLHNDTRKYFGAIAGVVFNDSEKIYALKNGFYVIEPSGDTFVITEPKGKYYPHEW